MRAIACELRSVPLPAGRKTLLAIFLTGALATALPGATLNCDLSQYRRLPGLEARVHEGPCNSKEQCLTNVVSTETTNSIQVGFLPTSANGFYRVVWTNAPPAEPLGSWEYQGF